MSDTLVLRAGTPADAPAIAATIAAAFEQYRGKLVPESGAFAETADNIAEHFRPALTAAANLPRLMLTDAELIEIRHGRPIAMPHKERDGAEWAAVDSADQLVAILHEKHHGQLWPVHNFSS